MKRFLLTLNCFILLSLPLLAQDDVSDSTDENVRDKMGEYIQQKLQLTKPEASRFRPVFVKYFHEWRQTIRNNRGDKLVMKQKVIDLQLRYRAQFRDIIGEQRSNRIYNHQEMFIRELKVLQNERRQRRGKRT